MHRAWVDDTACGEPSERVAEDLGDVTCPRCLASFEGWWGPDGTCPECDRSEVDGHGEECGLVTGESDLANSAPFARGAPGVGATRRPFLLGRRQALQQKRVRDEAAQLQHMEAQVAAHRARLEAMRTEVQP